MHEVEFLVFSLCLSQHKLSIAWPVAFPVKLPFDRARIQRSTNFFSASVRPTGTLDADRRGQNNSCKNVWYSCSGLLPQLRVL